MTHIYFENSYGNICQIHEGNCTNSSQVMARITEFCDKHRYKIPYSRFYNVDDKRLGRVTCIDVGSHSEFFYVAPQMNFATMSGEDGATHD